MSWLQRLFGKLKSVFGDKGAQGTATEAATPPRAKVSAEPAEKAPEPAAVLTEDKPADEPEDTAKEADKPAPADEPAAASAEPTADSAPEPTAEPAVPAADSTVEPTAESTTEPAATAEPAASAAPAASAEPVAAAAPTASAEPVAFAEPVAAAEPVEPATAPADEPVASAATEAPAAAVSTAQVAEVEPAPKPVERVNPAINTLDDDSRTAELIAEGPYGPGSGKPTADGSAPSADFTVKAKQSSKLFHTEKSPYFSRTKADVWFKTEADAEAAGFQAWDHKKRAGAKK